MGDRLLDEDFMPQLFGQKPVPPAPCPKCARPFDQALSGVEASYDFQRLGINRLMDLTTRLLIAPELAFTDTSELKRLLDQLPLDYVNYYDPIELPKWVDTDKLAVASKLWQANSIFMLAALAAASLPYCYMIEKAIPTLYDTKKLSESRYMYQRIFETGIFVNDVMSEGGLRVFKDFVPDGVKSGSSPSTRRIPRAAGRCAVVSWCGRRGPVAASTSRRCRRGRRRC